MSVYLYDEAIINSFRKLFDENQIYIRPVENSIRFTAQLNKDDVRFPMLSTTRLGYTIRSNEMNYNALHQGSYAVRKQSGDKIFAQVIPIKINYQLDIFAVDRYTCEEITREIIFYLYQNSSLLVKIPYNINKEHIFNIYLEDDIVDNSDTVQHFEKGVLFRNTLSLYTDDALLYSSKVFPNVVMDGIIKVNNEEEH